MNKTLLAGICMTLVLAIVVIFGPFFPKVDPNLEATVVYRDAEGKLMAPPYPPSSDFLLGSDRKGQDLYSKIIIGARETFLILGVIVLIRIVVSLLLAVFSFYIKAIRRFMFFWNALFSFIPPIFFILILLAVPAIMFSGTRSLWAILIISLLDVGRLSKIFYDLLRDETQKLYIEAAIASGCSKWKLFKNHYWKVMQTELFITTSGEAAKVMFLLAQLGVIGVFINQEFMSQLTRGLYQAVNTSLYWPVLLESIRGDIYTYHWIPFSVLGVITFTMIAFYLLGEGLRKRQDSKLRRSVT